LELLETCRQNAPAVKELEQPCRFLNPFYIDTRYPVHWPTQYDKDTALEAKQMAGQIRDWIKKSLNA
jgi:HEPN domain-containing protein